MLGNRASICGMYDEIATSSSGFEYGSGLRRTAYTTLKMAVLAPMPSASVQMAAAAKPGVLRNERSARRVSCQAASIHMVPLASRHSSLTWSMPPNSSRARRASSSDIPSAMCSATRPSRWNESPRRAAVRAPAFPQALPPLHDASLALVRWCCRGAKNQPDGFRQPPSYGLGVGGGAALSGGL